MGCGEWTKKKKPLVVHTGGFDGIGLCQMCMVGFAKEVGKICGEARCFRGIF